MPIKFDEKEENADDLEIQVDSIVAIAPSSKLNSLAESQKENAKLCGIIERLERGKTTRKLRRFSLKDGVLHCQCPRTGTALPIIPPKLVSETLREFHDDPMMGHMGVARTMERARRSVYFADMARKVTNYVKTCLTCQMRKSRNVQMAGKMQSLPIGNLFDRIQIDVVGPLPVSRRGNKYIVAAIEGLSKYVFAKAIKKNNSKAMVDFIMNQIIHIHGIPKTILSDNASTFRSNFYQKFHRLVGTVNLYTTPYHCQGNGLIERTNRVIEEILSNYVDSNQKNWEKYLGSTIYCINTAVHRDTTGYSSYYLLHGRHPNHPIDLNYSVSRSEGDFLIRIKRMQEARDCAKANLARAQLRQKAQYDKSHSSFEFKVDDLVLVFTPIKKKGLNPKLMHKYHGPYRIVRKVSALNYECEKLNAKKPSGIQKFHIQRLKPFHERLGDDMSFGEYDLKPVTQPVDSDDSPIRNPDRDLSDSDSDVRTDSSDSSSEEEVDESPGPDPAGFHLPPVVTRSGRTVRLPARYRE